MLGALLAFDQYGRTVAVVFVAVSEDIPALDDYGSNIVGGFASLF